MIFLVYKPMLYKKYLKEMTGCPFCKTKDRIFKENSQAFLTYAKAPYHPDHLLVIPKRHVTSFFDLTKEEKQKIDDLVSIGTKILKKLKYTNFTILVREGSKSNKSIPHLHYHLIPNIRMGDVDYKGKGRSILKDDEIAKLTKKINKIKI